MITMTSKDFLRLVLIVAAGHENYKLPCGLTVDELHNRAWRAVDKFNRAQIYKTACRVINNRWGWNQFAAAANFADKALDDDSYFTDNNHYEIGSFYTKDGYGAVEVDLFCYYESNKIKF